MGNGSPDDALRDQLADVGIDVVRAGLAVGSGGNVSARMSGAEACWVSRAGVRLDRLSRSDFALVRVDDGAVVGSTAAPSSEVSLHLAVYRARPDVNAVVHLHPQSALLLDALGERIRLVTTDHAYYVREVARVGYHLPGSAELADAAAAAVAGGVDCVVLARHGCVVAGDTVRLAHTRARNLEEAAQLTYRALLLGRRDLPELARSQLPP